MSTEAELLAPLAPGAGGAPSGAPADEEPEAAGPPEPTPGELRMYNFENWFTTDPNAKTVSIICANLICVAILTILFFATGNLHQLSGGHRFLELLWMAFGKMGGGGGMSPNGWLWPTRAVMILAGFMKMAAFSLLVNFLGDAIDSRMESLLEGKSRVLEEDFVLVLGWSDKILPLIGQLCMANESDGGGPIVILADMYKPDMDGFLWDNFEGETLGSKIVTRGGSPINPNDLEKCAASVAKSIVVLSQGFDPDEADAQTARAVLAVTGGMKYPPAGHLVVELRDADNVPVVKLGISDKMCPTEEEKNRKVLPIVGANLIGRLMVQCSIEPGLARVFDHILAFDGNEFYFSEISTRDGDTYWPHLVGKRFADACFMFADAIVLGVRLAVPNAEGQFILLNPPGTDILEDGDKILVIAEDNDTYSPGELQLTSCGAPPNIDEEPPMPTKTLLIGWRRDMQDMIYEVDKWVAEDSQLAVLAEAPDIQSRYDELADAELVVEDPVKGLKNCTLEMMVGNPILRGDLLDADLPQYDAVMILTEERDGTPGLQSDSRTMVTMLLCRDIQRKEGAAHVQTGEQPTLIAEILDPRTADLVALAACNDHMVSNLMVSEGLGQMSQEIDIHPLLEDLFSPEGNEMHIKDIKFFAHQGEYLSFWEIMNRARQRCEIALGYERDEDGERQIVLNPADKTEKICWTKGDRIVVLSED